MVTWRTMLFPDNILRAVAYSWAGLKAAFCSERAFRQELACAVILLPLAMILGKTGGEKALLSLSVLLVLIIELLNSAIEVLVDRVSPEWHELSGRAKDIGSAAVFLSIAAAIMVWILILFV